MGELVDILETFGCDMQHPGMGEFVLLYNTILANRTRGHKGPTAGAALRDIAAVRGKYYLALNSTMRAAIRPLLEADEEALQYFGIHMKDRTPCAAAEALAQLALAHLRGQC